MVLVVRRPWTKRGDFSAASLPRQVRRGAYRPRPLEKWGSIEKRCDRENRFIVHFSFAGLRYSVRTSNGEPISSMEMAIQVREEVRDAVRSGLPHLDALQRFLSPKRVYAASRLPSGVQESWKEEYRLRMLIGAQRRAKERGLECTITIEDIPVPSHCPVLGIPLAPAQPGTGRQDASPSIERIDCSRGYVRGNICVVSWRANKIKGNCTADELARVADWAAYMESCPPLE